MHRWILSGCLLPICAFAQARLIANYTIDARLNPSEKSVSGREVLVWTNDSQDTIPELQFHLYMNAFKNTKSTFMRESGGRLRGDRMEKDKWGYIDVKRMRIVGGDDLTKAIQFIAPDDGNKDDQTVIRVALPKPVAPGGQIQIEIDFYTKFPHVFARTGYHGDFFLGGQWFPKIGVWEKAGMRYATAPQWNCHQFHANTEFYADFGRYDVKLTVPSNFVVGATGVETGQVKNSDGTTTHSFRQENVHDFAWTAQPTFRRFVRTFDAEREVPATELTDITRHLGISHDEARLSNVEMILLLQPEHTGQLERHFRAIQSAIKYFGLWYGRYPHATITVVDPPAGGGGAGGMEYPTFITAGTSWIVGRNDGSPEEVIVHEFGHQYWQGIVATNEFEEAWMDEGFNTYSTGKIMDKVYGPRNLSPTIFIPLSFVMRTPTITSDAMNRAAYMADPKADDLFRYGWQYQNSFSYGLNSYMRTAAMLRTLENTLGDDVMGRVMRTYYERWKFGHPAAPDFISVVNTVANKDMNWFFREFLYGSNVADYSVASVASEPVRTDLGVFDESGGKKKTITSDDASKTDRKIEKKEQKAFRTKVTIRREGEIVYPVDISIRFENGETETRHWDGRYRWGKFEFVKKSKAASVTVDPDHKLLMDVNWANNSWVEKQRLGTTLKWSSSLLFWIQQILQSLSLIA
jgi:hypothetical protein